MGWGWGGRQRGAIQPQAAGEPASQKQQGRRSGGGARTRRLAPRLRTPHPTPTPLGSRERQAVIWGTSDVHRQRMHHARPQGLAALPPIRQPHRHRRQAQRPRCRRAAHLERRSPRLAAGRAPPSPPRPHSAQDSFAPPLLCAPLLNSLSSTAASAAEEGSGAGQRSVVDSWSRSITTTLDGAHSGCWSRVWANASSHSRSLKLRAAAIIGRCGRAHTQGAGAHPLLLLVHVQRTDRENSRASGGAGRLQRHPTHARPEGPSPPPKNWVAPRRPGTSPSSTRSRHRSCSLAPPAQPAIPPSRCRAGTVPGACGGLRQPGSAQLAYQRAWQPNTGAGRRAR